MVTKRRLLLQALGSFGFVSAALGGCGGEEAAPVKIHLIPDEYHLTDVGALSDGRLYWIDVQLNFDPVAGETRDFVCIYVFDSHGEIISADVTDLGFRSAPLLAAPEAVARALASLPNPVRRDIWVKPFSIEEHGVTFGLVVRGEGGESVVDAMPGMTLMFYAPWSEGGYDT